MCGRQQLLRYMALTAFWAIVPAYHVSDMCCDRCALLLEKC